MGLCPSLNADQLGAQVAPFGESLQQLEISSYQRCASPCNARADHERMGEAGRARPGERE